MMPRIIFTAPPEELKPTFHLADERDFPLRGRPKRQGTPVIPGTILECSCKSCKAKAAKQSTNERKDNEQTI